MQANRLAENREALEPLSADVVDTPERKDFVILGLILAAYACCFLPICFRVGFYLDDWLTFWNLHFAPHNFFDLLKASFSDPRMVTRPLQCVYYASTYFLFGDRPLGYHLVNFAFEFLSATFLYLGLKRLSGSRFVATLSALIFLVYPSHDATHYWIGAGLGPGFGLTLYLASFCLCMHAFTSKRRLLYVMAIATYAMSAFCYEAFLPMLVMSFCSVLLLSAENRTESRLNTMAYVIMWFLPFVAVGLVEPIYQRVLLPKMTHVFLSPSGFDLSYSFNVFVQGLNVSMFNGLWLFLAQRLREALISMNPLNFVQLLGVLASATLAIVISYTHDQVIRYRRLFTASIVTFFASYLTFAVAQGYTPVLETMINRVNIGSSVAVSMLLALGIAWLLKHMRISKRRAMATSIIIAMPLLAVMVLADQALSSFWICSWDVQKDIRYLIKQNANQIKDGDCIILANTHRYLMWAPVFDGTWDFQNMLRMTLNKNTVSGGVVSDRLSVDSKEIKDVSAGYLCASYPVDKVTVLLPSADPMWNPIKTSAEFVDLVEKNSKKSVTPETLKLWRANLVK